MPITAILRTYNNERTIGVIEQLAKPEYGIDNFNVVIHADAEREKGNDTAAKLKDHPLSQKIIPIPISPYGWSRALNAGIEALPKESNLVFMISNEVGLSPEQFKSMKERAKELDASGSYVIFKGPEGIVLNYFTYNVGRNTCFVWKADLFKELGNFNLHLDKGGGMEDVEFALRTFAFTGLIPKKAAEQIPIEIRQGTDMKLKTDKEMETIRLIESVYNPNKVSEFYSRLGVLEKRRKV